MYNYGLVKFLEAKKLKSNEAINGFLIESGVTEFTAKHHNRVNAYIQANWTRFCSWVDKGLREGTLNGKSVKLNTYYDEIKERQAEIFEEYRSLNLSKEQEELLNIVFEDNFQSAQSFLSKIKNTIIEKKNQTYTSNKLRFLPIVNQIIDNDWFEEFIIYNSNFRNKTI
jgi:hypothetical protein